MKKILLSAILAIQTFAGGDIETPTEIDLPGSAPAIHHDHEESRYYVVLSGLVLLGDEFEHGKTLLDGNDNPGYGFGLDIGYRIGNGFAFEYDFTYGKNDVKEIIDSEVREVGSEYYTSALDIVYTYEATEHLGLFGKVGYEYEWEKISKLGIDSKEHDFVFGAGIEYKVNESYKAIVEYEYSMIEGPHGDAILAGIMYNL